MDSEFLLRTALKLKQVSQNAYNEYYEKSDELIGKINEEISGRKDLKSLIGDNNFEMMKDNHANHVRFIASILRFYDAEVLVNTVLWVFNAYIKHGFKANYWSAQLNAWIFIINTTLSKESAKEILPYYEWMQINIPVFVKLANGNNANLQE